MRTREVDAAWGDGPQCVQGDGQDEERIEGSGDEHLAQPLALGALDELVAARVDGGLDHGLEQLVADPKAAVARAIENHPKLRQAEAVAVEMAKNQALAKLQTAHPDMRTILSSTDFQSWVGKSNFRQGLYQQADINYDYAAADELLTLFKEAKGVVAEAAKIEKVAQKSAVKQASTGTSRVAAEGKSRKVYRRRDIIELMNTDPKRYDAMSEEIMKAYREGRVK